MLALLEQHHRAHPIGKWAAVSLSRTVNNACPARNSTPQLPEEELEMLRKPGHRQETTFKASRYNTNACVNHAWAVA